MRSSREQNLPDEREPPPYFAGRETELQRLSERLSRVVLASGTMGGLMLIEGVPGAGKTQLAVKFAKDAADASKRVKVAMIGTDMLADPVGLLLEFGRVVGAESAARQAAELDVCGTGRTVDVAKVVAGGYTRDHARHSGSFGRMLRATHSTKMWRNVDALVLVVDELQTVTADGITALQVLHEGTHGCPIMLLGVGLQNTRQVLASLGRRVRGISRLVDAIRLGNLSEEAAADAIEHGLDRLGRNIPRHRALELAAPTFGFPQHVHGHLVAACDVYDRHGALATDDQIARARDLGARKRTVYYDSRLESIQHAQKRFCLTALVERMTSLGETVLDRREAESALAEIVDDGAAFLDETIAKGVLTANSLGGLTFGIPSFHSYMVDQVQAAVRRR